jgi:cytochrome b561
MLQDRNARKPGYDGVAKFLHWLIVLLLIAQFSVAWTMPHIHRGVSPVGLIAIHLSLGAFFLLVVIARLAWSLTHRVPLLTDGIPWWQHRAAQALHALLYLVLVLLPLQGWANANARGWDVAIFGVPLPKIMATQSRLGMQLGDIHQTTGIVLLVLVWLHVLAALYHHLMLRDRVLLRMLPEKQ